MAEEAQAKAGTYPFSTELTPDDRGRDGGGYSIFLLSLRHRVHLRESLVFEIRHQQHVRERQSDWCRTLSQFHWGLHPHLTRGSGEPGGKPARARSFEPSRVLCKSAQEALLGGTFAKAPADDALDLVRRRLDANDSGCPREEPLLLTFEGEGIPLFRRPLEVAARIADEQVYLGFQVDWADLWLFPDGHALKPHCNAILACKVVPTSVTGPQGQQRTYRVGDLAVLNRLIRDLDLGERGGAWLRNDGVTDAPAHFWEGVLRHWIGVQPRTEDREVVVDSARGRRTVDNVLRLERGDPIWADRHSDYVKVLTAARITDPGKDSGWDCPQVEPRLSPSRVAGEQAQGVWTPEQSAWLQVDGLGYPGLGDALLYELASTTSEGGALGLDGSHGFQVSTDYLRHLFAQSSIEIWEYWRGLALRDTCAFLAWRQEMPILWQAEERYYILYLHTYYCQLRLHDLSEDIIEHELTDVPRAREIRHAFMQFRNQFWFRETAIGFQGIAVADAMKSGLGLDALYNSVSAEIEEVGRYVDEEASAGRQKLIALAVAFIYPVAFLWNLNQDWIMANLKTLNPFWHVVLILVGGFLVGLLYLWFGSRLLRWFGRLANIGRRKGWW